LFLETALSTRSSKGLFFITRDLRLTIEFNDRAECLAIPYELTQLVTRSSDPLFKSRPPSRHSVHKPLSRIYAVGWDGARTQSSHFARGFVLIEEHALQCAAQELLGRFARSIQRIPMALWKLTCGERLVFSMHSIQRITS
jgi:hypothetical protein